MKKILIDVGHPAQVHQFKYVYFKLKELGYIVHFTAKNKEITHYLLDQYNIPYSVIGTSKKGLFNKVLSIPRVCSQFYKVLNWFKPNLIISRFSFQASWVSKFLGIPHIALTDTEHIGLADTLTVPFVDTKLTAYSYEKKLGRNHIRYNGNIELFYLHPNRFTPTKSIYSELGLNEGEKYSIVRFVSWDAHHDVGEEGLTLKGKISLVKKISTYMKVFITSEQSLPPDLEKYKIQISPDKIHDALAFASLYVGEGGTMASEASVLGTPAIYINTLPLGYVKEEANAGLAFIFKSELGLLEKTEELINSDINFKNRRTVFLKDKIDPTAFLIWFIENYPKSKQIMKENPVYQYKFK